MGFRVLGFWAVDTTLSDAHLLFACRYNVVIPRYFEGGYGSKLVQPWNHPRNVHVYLTRGHAFENKYNILCLIVEEQREVTWEVLIISVCSSTEEEHMYICFQIVLVTPAG